MNDSDKTQGFLCKILEQFTKDGVPYIKAEKMHAKNGIRDLVRNGSEILEGEVSPRDLQRLKEEYGRKKYRQHLDDEDLERIDVLGMIRDIELKQRLREKLAPKKKQGAKTVTKGRFRLQVKERKGILLAEIVKAA